MSCRPSSQLIRSRIKWLRKRPVQVICYIRSVNNAKIGPFIGTVVGISDNQVAVESEGGKTYDATGLLVKIDALGRNETYGDWPVRFEDAKISSSQAQ